MKQFLITLVNYNDKPIRSFNDTGVCQTEVYFRIKNEYYGDMEVKYIFVSETKPILTP